MRRIIFGGELQMKRRNLKRLSYTLMAGSFLVTSGAAIATPLFTSQAATTQTTQALADDTSARSVTVTKYLGENGPRGDGETAPTSGDLLSGVKFSLTKVKVIKVDGGVKTDITNQSYASSLLVNPSSTPEYQEGAADGIYYEKDGSPLEGTTDKNGQYKFDLGTGKAKDGVYILEETDSSAAVNETTGEPAKVTTPASPSFIDVPMTSRKTDAGKGLIYDIKVFPKNQSSNMNPTKSIEDVDADVNKDGLQPVEDGSDGGSIEAGQQFTWNADVNIPTGLYFKEAAATTKDTYKIATNADGSYAYNADGSLKYEKTTSTSYAADQEEFGYFVLSDKLNEKLTLNDVKPRFD